MNIADVTIAGAGIGLSVRFRAIAVGIADGAAAYGPERFNAGTVGRRRRRLEASDPRIPIAGSVRNGVFASIETIPCKPTKPTYLGTFDDWPRCKVCKRWKMLPRDGLPRHMFCIALRKRT